MRGKKIITTLLSLTMILGSTCVNFTSVGADELTKPLRKVEQLDRGLVALKATEGIYISWRLFNTEDNIFGVSDENVSFNIYRDGKLIKTEEKTTNYTDTAGTTSSLYAVSTVIDGVEGEKCNPVKALSSGSNYLEIPLDIPADFTAPNSSTYGYSVGDASCGDLDGDGEYELIIKWDCNPQDSSNSGFTGNVLFDAYKLDGTMLWRIDLGINIRSGAHYTQFMVYDLDGDGKAEIGIKTAPGSKDGLGNYVSDASLVDTIKSADNTQDYRIDGGYILKGPEYYTVFNGETGGAIDTIEYPTLRGTDKDNNLHTIWGDNYGNRVDRHLATIAYLDGENPSIIEWRGYYGGQSGKGAGRTAINAITLVDGRLQVEATFDTWSKASRGYTKGNEQYIGQGNHNITVADVDGDGRDEVLSGSLCFEDYLTVKWCSFKGHGDALHIGDYDPTHEGYEYFSVHEGGGYINQNGVELDYGMTVYDAETGEDLKHVGRSKDTGRGVMANVGAGGYYQLWGAGTYKAMGDNKFDSASIRGASSNFRVFWDGDLYDELLDGVSITDWNGSKMSEIFNAKDCVQINGSKANPALQADLFGDWREEVVYPLSNNTAIRVYTTNIQTDYKMMTLMHDSIYRAGVAAENTAYNQPPHIGFYLAEEMYNGIISNVVFNTDNANTTYKLGEEFSKDGIEVTAKYKDGTEAKVTSYSVKGYDPLKAGEQTVEFSYRNVKGTFTVNVLDETGINVIALKDTVNVGESFNKSDFEVYLKYGDEVQVRAEDFEISSVDSMSAGIQTLKFSYNGLEKSLTQNVSVNVATSFVANKSGKIIDYNNNGDKEVIVPSSINGVEITTISEKALYDVDFEKLYIYNSDLIFEPTDFNVEGYSVSDISTNSITVNVAQNDVNIYLAKYDNGLLTNISEVKAESTGENLISTEFEADTVYIWRDMMPLAKHMSGDIKAGDFIIAATEGSTSQAFALSKDLDFEIIVSANKVTFEEEFYSSYINKNMLMQNADAQELKDEFVTYNVSAAVTNAPWFTADNFGFSVVKQGDNTYMAANAGIYDDWNQFSQVYIAVNDPAKINEITKPNIISFDICIPTGTTTPYLELQNDVGTVIDTINTQNTGLKTDVWYNYELVYENGGYTRTIYNTDGSVFKAAANLQVSDSATTTVSNIVFKQDFTWGTETIKGIIYIDNISLDR